MPSPNDPQSRRTFLKRGSATVAGTAVAGGLPALALGADAAMAAEAAAMSPVVRENTLTDSSTHSSDFRTTNISSTVEGFARRSSVNLGEPIDLVVIGPNIYLPGADAPPAEYADIELYRLGYYGGKGARLVWKTERVSTWQRFDDYGNPAQDGVETRDLPRDPSTGLRGRALNDTSVTIPGDAAPESGVYLAKLKGHWPEFPPGAPPIDRTGESHVIFIVRDDSRPRDVLALLPTNTWQAYNYWGGRSFYIYSSRYQNSGSLVPATGTERAAKLSLDRPYNNWIGDLNWVLRTEFPAIYWLEQQGYDVAYTDDVALHFDPAQVKKDKSKSLVILGHGEYWTKEMRDAVEAGRDSGTSIYNFGANTAYWSVRYENILGKPARTAEEARVIVCYKTIEGGGASLPDVSSTADPVSPTTTFRDPGKGPNVSLPGTTSATPATYAGPNRPESALLGVQYIGDDDQTNRPLTVPADNGKGEFAGHRAWRNCKIPKTGASIGANLLGWEWDGITATGQAFSGPAPKTKSGTTLQRLSETDPRVGQPSGAVTTFLQDGGRTYGARGGIAQPPANWNPFAHAVTYTAPSGALVFSSGTIQWSWGLGPHYLHTQTQSYAAPATDESQLEIQQATANLLYDGGVLPATPVGIVLTDGGPGPGPVDTTAPIVTAQVQNTRSILNNAYNINSRTRAFIVKVIVDKSEVSGPVTVDLVLRDSKGELGTSKVTLAPGKNTTTTITISSAAFQRVPSRLLSYLVAELRVTGTDAVGNARTQTLGVRLRAA